MFVAFLLGLLLLFLSRRIVINIKLLFLILITPPLLFYIFSSQITFFYESRIKHLFNDVEGGNSIGARRDMYSEAINIFYENPFLGEGTNSFPFYSKWDIYPHNLILEIAAEFGILGLIILSVFIISNLFNFNKLFILQQKNKSLQSFSLVSFGLLAFTFSLITSQFSGDLFDSRFIFFFSVFSMNLYKVLPIEE
ncbi:hypothetical protein GCM10010954_21860 [Halobacillus andaensis]|uniref:O-antigen ligase-related domain-containing protein n=2 Tax=Halobacillus andaensis TaxID=1176239 RepID=A0A917B6T1_HALAA|nr:hypothetical protein GCM10010954_21860 [Halobacillus andaensis]